MKSPRMAPPTAKATTLESATLPLEASTPPSTTAISPGMTKPKKSDASAQVRKNTAPSAHAAGMAKKRSINRCIRPASLPASAAWAELAANGAAGKIQSVELDVILGRLAGDERNHPGRNSRGAPAEEISPVTAVDLPEHRTGRAGRPVMDVGRGDDLEARRHDGE